jgi:putative transposase
MVKRTVYQAEKHVFFITFACYRRRQFLTLDLANQIVIGQLGSRLTKHDGICCGFVIMPDHVHAMVWFPEPHQLSPFMNHWKDQSSKAIKQLYREKRPRYLDTFNASEPIWQPRYFAFNIWSRRKAEEKLEYMHLNPIRAGLVEKSIDWKWSSARWYELQQGVGLPIGWPPGMEIDDEFVVSG